MGDQVQGNHGGNDAAPWRGPRGFLHPRGHRVDGRYRVPRRARRRERRRRGPDGRGVRPRVAGGRQFGRGHGRRRHPERHGQVARCLSGVSRQVQTDQAHWRGLVPPSPPPKKTCCLATPNANLGSDQAPFPPSTRPRTSNTTATTTRGTWTRTATSGPPRHSRRALPASPPRPPTTAAADPNTSPSKRFT